jgi:hypothetical protein
MKFTLALIAVLVCLPALATGQGTHTVVISPDWGHLPDIGIVPLPPWPHPPIPSIGNCWFPGCVGYLYPPYPYPPDYQPYRRNGCGSYDPDKFGCYNGYLYRRYPQTEMENN